MWRLVASILFTCLIWTAASAEDEDDKDGPKEIDVHDANLNNPLMDEKIVEIQINLDKKIFQMEAEAEQRDIQILREVNKYNNFSQRYKPPKSFMGYMRTVVQFQGTPFDIFIYIIMPIVLGRFFSALLRNCKPIWLDDNKTITEYPLVPLVYFQQTNREVRLKRSGRKTINGISKYFIIRANETYIELQEIRDAALTRQTLTRSPWALVRFMIRLQMIHAHAYEQNRDPDKNQQSEKNMKDQKQQMDLLRYTNYSSDQDKAIFKLAKSDAKK